MAAASAAAPCLRDYHTKRLAFSSVTGDGTIYGVRLHCFVGHGLFLHGAPNETRFDAPVFPPASAPKSVTYIPL